MEQNIQYYTSEGYVINGVVSWPDKEDSVKKTGIVLIHGSSALDQHAGWPDFLNGIPQTYDGKPGCMYADIADFLAPKGFCSFRASKRGVKKSITDVDFDIYKTTSFTEVMNDAHLQIDIFKKETGIQNIVLLGWSEGSITAVKLAEERNDIAGLILMGVVAERFDIFLRHFFKNDQEHLETVNEIKKLPDQEMMGVDRPAGRAKELFNDIPNYKRLEKLSVPSLILQGEIDVETPVEQARLLKKSQKTPGCRYIEYPGFGHGFCPHLGAQGEIKTVGPFDKKVLNDICQWLDDTY